MQKNKRCTRASLRRLLTPALVTASLLGTGSAALSAEPVPQVAVVFDASGSMWGQVDGRAKIEIAREAVGKLVKQFEGKPLELGLIAYGHRRKGDCADIEIIQPVAPLDGKALTGRVDGLVPKGMTPLSQAVLDAAELVKFTEQKATVILLSDGIETCKLDPCAVGGQLEAKGVDFTAHVIGFDIRTETDKAQLACLAQATGGRYFDARDTEGLLEAMQQAGQAAVTAPAKSPVPKMQLAVKSPVAIASRVEVAWEGEKSPDDMIVIVQKGAAPTSKNRIVLRHVDRSPEPLSAPNLPGEYDVVYVVDGYNRNAEAARVPLQVVEAPVTLVPQGKAYAASQLGVEWQGPSGKDQRIVVIPEGAPVNPSTVVHGVAPEGKRVTVKMPSKPGRYELAFVGDYYGKMDVMLRQPLDVEAFPVELDVPDGVPAGKPFALSWSGPSGGDERIAVVKRGSVVNPSTVISLAWVEREDVIELNSPEQAGDYDVVFVSDYYGRADVLARVPLSVR